MNNGRATSGGGPEGEFEVVGERPSETIVRAVSEVRECDPVELPPLHSALDPDALDELFEDTVSGRPRRGGSLAFEYADCRVSVLGGETIRVEETD
ncbi:HalOD1 output domain-containing protein [Halorussus ruber]|uniref:HalOD1 output domain-containing protein n=1 Tax=Halorussus ruber TaxID=1126238 RepID=UPI0010923226|nr:HalOD1 output domain-containing protein [Halorussus ruber]